MPQTSFACQVQEIGQAYLAGELSAKEKLFSIIENEALSGSGPNGDGIRHTAAAFLMDERGGKFTAEDLTRFECWQKLYPALYQGALNLVKHFEAA